MAPEFRKIEDARMLRAVAHPLRLRLLGSLRMDGPATASVLGRRLGESSGATSYHLRILARDGFVVDAPERNRGRERWWQAADEGIQWSLDTDDRELLEADSALGRRLVGEYAEQTERWYRQMPSWPRRWRAAATTIDRFFELTASELRELSDELAEVLERRVELSQRRPGSERVIAIVQTFPQRRGEP